jgi:hypothetical protein
MEIGVSREIGEKVEKDSRFGKSDVNLSKNIHHGGTEDTEEQRAEKQRQPRIARMTRIEFSECVLRLRLR